MGNSGDFPKGKPAATESRYPSLINDNVHAGSFRVSVIHRTLTWTTVSLTCVRDHAYPHRGWLGTDSESAQHFWLGKTLRNVSCAPNADRARTLSLFRSRVRRCTNWATPSPNMNYSFACCCAWLQPHKASTYLVSTFPDHSTSFSLNFFSPQRWTVYWIVNQNFHLWYNNIFFSHLDMTLHGWLGVKHQDVSIYPSLWRRGVTIFLVSVLQ